jgi:tRNA threonylcarbamoyladenosine biosynthesis protein TsaB
VNVLAFDGALGAFSAAIARDGQIVAWRCEAGNIALERGLAFVESVLDQAQLTPSGVDRLAVGIGPGGFTGLRIAIAYAKSLSAAWAVPLVPILSFDLLEYGRTFERVLTVVVGRPGVISARYRFGEEIHRASGRTADVLDALVPSFDSAQDDIPAQDDIGAKTLPVVGAPKDVLYALAERAIIVRSVDPLVTPPAAAAALAAPSRTPPTSLHQVRADYGELPAAKIPKL